jgi:hypothetical protein
MSNVLVTICQEFYYTDYISLFVIILIRRVFYESYAKTVIKKPVGI